MNKKLAIFLLSLFLTGCKFKNQHVTEESFMLHSENNVTDKVVLPKIDVVNNWPNSINFVNLYSNNFYLDKTSNLNTIKLTNSKISAPPIIAENKMFIINENTEIFAYDLTSMQLLWSNKIESNSKNSNFTGGGVLYNNGILYISYGGRNVVALNANKGYEIFRKKLANLVKVAPVIYKNFIFALTVDNYLYCIDFTTGEVIWEHHTIKSDLVANNITPLIHKDKIIIGYSSNQIQILNAKNGDDLGEVNDDSFADFEANIFNLSAQPIIKNSLLYTATEDGQLTCTDLNSRVKIWSRGIININNFNLIGNTIFVTTGYGQLAAISGNNGNIIWVTNLVNNNKKKHNLHDRHYYLTPIAINDQITVFGKGGYYNVMPHNGEISARMIITKKLQNPKFFAISNNVLYVFDDHNVYIIK